MRLLSFSALAWCGVASPILAQTITNDSVRCAAALSAPTSDSITIEVNAIVQSFDTTRRIPAGYGEMVGVGLRQMLVLPRPLLIDTYDPKVLTARGEPSLRSYAAATLRSFYRLTLHQDGRLTNIRLLAGVRNEPFNRAIIDALVALDTSRLLPPPSGFERAFSGDTVALQLTVMPVYVSGSADGKVRSIGMTPLFRFRTPLFPVEAPPGGLPNGPRPHYPDDMRQQGIEGNVMFEFLVHSDGIVDPESMIATSATSLEFVNAVSKVVPRMRFYPMKIVGCPVAALVQMPFVFGLNR